MGRVLSLRAARQRIPTGRRQRERLEGPEHRRCVALCLYDNTKN